MDDLKHFESFMNAYQDMVFGTAMRLLGNAADAEDIAQEVFLKAFEKFSEICDSPTAAGWLRTVARNLSLNHITRHRARWSNASDMYTGADEDRDYLAELPAPDVENARWDLDDKARWLENGLSKLPPHQRIPLVLYHFDELSYEEIAEKLGVSLSKIKTDIHRGRDSLRNHLQRAGISLGLTIPQ